MRLGPDFSFFTLSKRKGLDGSSSYRSFIRYPGSAISQSRNEAAPRLESPLPVDPLGFGVDVRETDFDVFRPERHQAYLG